MKKSVNRRDFIKGSSLALVAARYLGVSASTTPAAPSPTATPIDTTEIMKAAAAAVSEINGFFVKTKAELEAMKQMKTAMEKAECTKALSIIAALVIVVVAVVIAVVTFGAGAQMTALSVILATQSIAKALASVDELESALIKQKKLTPELQVHFERFRFLCAQIKDVVIARDVFFHLSQDKAHAAKLLEVVRAKNRAAIEELLNRDTPSRNLIVEDVKDENGIFLSLRIGRVRPCFSSTGRCGGKTLSLLN